LVLLGVFLVTWQAVVPTAVRERVTMTKDANGQLEASAQERVDLWTNAEESILHNPILGTGFATFQYGQHVADLKDTHNWYVKVLVETGLVGFIIAMTLLVQLISTSYRLFKRGTDPLYRGLGLGLFVCIWTCIAANFFGDRWTYLEITGPLWLLVGTAVRAMQLEQEATGEASVMAPVGAVNPYMAYR
jgi:putative inorganic carbon (hco3(-)) transporter